MELTQLEKNVFIYIRNTLENEGFAPSVRDICRACSIKSTSTAHAILHRLANQGHIYMEQGKSRTIRIEKDKNDSQTLRVPILGKVAAGTPITAIENYDGYVDFPTEMTTKRSGMFALRVQGDSMIDAGILNGDLVIVEGRHFADNGEIVVAMINDEATVKRVFFEKAGVRLQPENPKYEPIFTRDAVILGKVIANFRFY